MSRLGKRERHEKRKRLEAERRLAIIRKGELQEVRRLERLLPRRELKLLSAAGHGELSVNNLHGMTHYAGAYVGRSPGTGKQQRRAIPDRFKTDFMADGHEKLKTETLSSGPSMVKTGHVYRNGVKTKRVIWKEVGKPDTKPV